MSGGPGEDAPDREVSAFYDELADHYHLLFQDWDRSMARQAAVLGPLVERYTGKPSAEVLDCACGIGTQAIGLAQRGHRMTACDLSERAVERARGEAIARGVSIPFCVADMRSLPFAPQSFDVVLVADNALPHLLSDDDLRAAVESMAGVLRAEGVLIATVRDYDELSVQRPTMQPPSFFHDAAGERFVHQVWEWDGDTYAVHLYLTWRHAGKVAWTVKHFHSRYRALRRDALTSALQQAGFGRITWNEPKDSNFYQPIVVARRQGGRDASFGSSA